MFVESKSDELTRNSTVDNNEQTEVGTMLAESKSDDLTRNSTVDNSEQKEVGTMLAESKSDELTRDSTVDNNEQKEVGTMFVEHKSDDDLTRNSTVDNNEQKEVGLQTTTPLIPTTPTINALTHGLPPSTNNELIEVGTMLAESKSDELTRNSTVDNNEASEVGLQTTTTTPLIPTTPTINALTHVLPPSNNNELSEVGTMLEERKSDYELTRNSTVDNNEQKEVGLQTTTTTTTPLIRGPSLSSNSEQKEAELQTTTTTSEAKKTIPTGEVEDNNDDEEEKEEEDFPPSNNTDREKNKNYMKSLSSPQDNKIQDKFLKLLRLEQNKDVNAINFTSLFELMSGGNQIGGANALYIDLDQETTLYSQKKKQLENEVTKQQEDELALLSKQSEDLNKDETVQEVKWKYFVTIELHLYPGDHIPLSAYASLACSKKSNDIYNIWQNIITKTKNPDSKEKYKKTMLSYVPVIPNKTVKNKDTSEPVIKNNTVKVRDSKNPEKPIN